MPYSLKLKFVYLFALLIGSSFLWLGCNKKVEYVNHLQHTTLKLAPAVKIKIRALEETRSKLVLKPEFTTHKPLSDIKVTWLLSIDENPGQIIFAQDLSREEFNETSLQEVHVEIQDPSLNHKVVLIAEGKSDGIAFNLTSIYNSLFQKDIEEAKSRLLERSSRKVIQDKREYQD